MNQSHSEIAELAEFIAEENIVRGAVNLAKIANKRDVEIHYDYFENFFTGMLQYEDGMFDIFINLAQVGKEKYPRARFTVAHELGHYFIDDHRNKLKRGFSLSYDRNFSYFTNNPIEREANLFATNLLMPKGIFVNEAYKLEIGINAIKSLSKRFKTSLTSTAIQYHQLINFPCGLIFWNRDMTFRNKNYSDSFYDRIKQFSHNFNVYDEARVKIFKAFNNDSFGIIEVTSINSSLAYFYPDININTKYDIPVCVDTISLQSYGYLSFFYIK